MDWGEGGEGWGHGAMREVGEGVKGWGGEG